MQNDNKYRRYTWFVLLMVMLVIMAGGVVRMTQSGMGCPDWPRCFGRWVPPTSASQLPADYEKYLQKQDIDHTFNVWHTWIEYINRLLGALLGVFIFIHFIWSTRKYWKKNRSVVYLSLFLLLATGFQGWLGKRVVDANLAAVKITTHMLVALLIAAIPLIILNKVVANERVKHIRLKYLSVAVLIILLLQIVLGTQVREQVDEISRALGYQHRELWISRLDKIFIIHRSFSWVVVVACFYLWWISNRIPLLKGNAFFVLLTAIGVSLLGIIMAYMQMPALAQPLHLLAASILVLAVFNLQLKIK